MATLLLLMPKFCNDCKSSTPYFQTPGYKPEITCLRCENIAFPHCVKKEDIRNKKTGK